MPTSDIVIIDDRPLVAVLVGAAPPPPAPRLATASHWYYRACRAAIGGGAGRLSGHLEGLAADDQRAAIEARLALPARISGYRNPACSSRRRPSSTAVTVTSTS
ncbi:MAG: hypothetical protein ACRD1K_14395 [Acidimicrobiales bacterium]